jgi:large subunit ribosomal protein L31
MFPGKKKDMKEGIHPKYVECTITCACGESVKTRATKPSLRVEVCSKCHPFFTQQHRFVDTEGRVEKFVRKYQKKQPAPAAQP